MRAFRPHLCVDREPTVKRVTWAGDKPHGEFALEHEDACSGGGRKREELKDERRGNLCTRQNNCDKSQSEKGGEPDTEYY